MFKELKETMSKDLNEFIRMRDYQIENTNREAEMTKNQMKILELQSPETEVKRHNLGARQQS